jgi:hypothetical protein
MTLDHIRVTHEYQSKLLATYYPEKYSTAVFYTNQRYTSIVLACLLTAHDTSHTYNHLLC